MMDEKEKIDSPNENGLQQQNVKRRFRPSFTISGYIGVAIIAFHFLNIIFGPFIAPYLPAEIITDDPFTDKGLLGTDILGRDILSRVLWAGRLTIGLAFSAALFGFFVGTILGLLAAAAGRWLDQAISRVNDVVMSFPSIMLALIVIVGLGSSIPVLIITVGFIQATRVYRVVRAVALDMMVVDFVEVARARGEGHWWIMRREVLPNIITPLAAEFGLRLIFCLLLVSSLSFLGLGIQPPSAGWGIMVRENLAGLMLGSWAPIFPALAICTLTIGINFIVDWLLGFTKQAIKEEMVK
jgi:peptide/nickel transport system permease protein